jgi:uncharacterized protein YdbL (DUF1318 family)
MRLMFVLTLAATVLVPSAALAQNYPELAAARAAGQVGERYDGYLGFAAASAPAVQRQVQSINIRRRSLYAGLGQRRGVSPQMAGIATGCELLSRVAVGEVYLLQGGVWRHREAGQPAPHPSYCG